MTCGFGPEYDKLKEQLGEAKAVAVFHLAGETVPSLEKALELLQTPEVKFALKSVEIANSIPAKREWIKLQNNKISLDQFLLNAQFPKEQKDLVREVYTEDNPKTLDDLIIGINSRMSYTVEINTAIQNRFDSRNEYGDPSDTDMHLGVDQYMDGEWKYYKAEDNTYWRDSIYGRGRQSVTKAEYDKVKDGNLIPTSHYSNLTVPGGTNYIENEIATPGIVPSIKGHAQFSTDNGIGWFRSDDKYPVVKGWKKDNVEWIDSESAIYNVLEPSDRIIWGHPTIGKSFLKEKGDSRFITLDDDYANEVNNFIDTHRGSRTRQEYKGAKPKEYNEFMLNLFDRLKQQVKKENKLLFVSNTNILKERMQDFDKVITIPKEEFKKRFDKRGSTYGFEDWKSDIDNSINTVDSNKVVSTTGYLSDLLREQVKTRRILEVQSDLFQKGRNQEDLISDQRLHVFPLPDNKGYGVYETKTNKLIKEFDDIMVANDYVANSPLKDATSTPSNQFLQLLNKDGNWIPFFIKSIVQDSAKKGYEKVLFPTGDTASKVEGHETLEQFKRQKEERLELVTEEYNKHYNRLNRVPEYGFTVTIDDKTFHYEKAGKKFYLRDFNNSEKDQLISEEKYKKGLEKYYEEQKNYADKAKIEKEQLQEELKRVETEGFAALKPIYDFYENRVYNSLKKIYGKDKVERIKDEYGNEWYQVGIEQKRDVATVFTSQPQQGLGLTTAKFEGLSQPTFGLTQATGMSTMTASTIRERKSEVPKTVPEKVEKLKQDQTLLQLDDTIDPETKQRRHKYFVTDTSGKRLYDIRQSVTESIHKNVRGKEGKEELALLLAEHGTKAHKTFEDIIKSYLNPDGSIKDAGGGLEFKLEDGHHPASFYKIHEYVTDLINSYRGKNVTIIPEAKIVKGKETAGTIDLLVIHEDGSYDKYDWKFIKELSEYKGLDKERQKGFKEQSDKLADILKTEYGLSDRRIDMMLPIKVKGKEVIEGNKTTDFTVEDIAIAPFDPAILGPKEMYLQPFVINYVQDDNTQIQTTLNSLHDLYNHSIHNYESKDFSTKNAIDRDIKRVQEALFGLVFRKDLSSLTKYLLGNLAYVPLAVSRMKGGDKSINPDRLIEKLEAIRKFGTQGLQEQYREQVKKADSADEVQILDERISEFRSALGLIDDRIKMLTDASTEITRGLGKLGGINTDVIEAELAKDQRWVTSMTQVPMANMHVTSKMVYQAAETSLRQGKEKAEVFKEDKEAIKKKDSNPIKAYEKYLLEETKHGKLRLIHKFKQEFFDERKKIIQKTPEEMQEWFKKNTVFDRVRYEQHLAHLTKDLEDATQSWQIADDLWSEPEISFDDMQTALKEFQERNDPGEDFSNIKALKTGDFANKYLIGNDSWHSPRFTEMAEKHPELLKLYDDVTNVNKELANQGLLEEREMYTFYPNVTTGVIEGMRQGENMDLINRWWHEISVSHGEMVQKKSRNPLTDEPWKELDMPYLGDGGIKGHQSKNVPDVYTEVVKALEKFKSLRSLENPLTHILIAEKNKKIKARDEHGKISEAEVQNKTNAELLRDIIDIQLYGASKGSEKTSNLANTLVGKVLKLDKDRELSTQKVMHTGITANTVIRLTASIPSIMANLVGGHGNINFHGKSGLYFNAHQMKRTWLMWSTRDKNLYSALKYFDFRMQAKKDNQGFTDYALWGQRVLGDETVEQMIGGAMLQMYKLTPEGKVVNIRQEILRNMQGDETISPKELEKRINKESEESSLLSTMKLDKDSKPYWELNGKKIDLNEVPKDENNNPTALTSPLVDMKAAVLQVVKKSIGNMDPQDRSGMHMFDLARAFTQFRNWVPGTVQSRYGRWKYEPMLDTNTVGRWREFFSDFLSKEGVGGFMKLQLARYSFFGGDLGNPSLRGASDARYEKVRAEMAKNGIEFKMSPEEFFHMQVGIAKSMARETLVVLGTLSLLTLVGYLHAQQDDPDTKAQLAYTHKLLDKFYNEFSFYFNPAQFEELFQNSVPVVSLLKDMQNTLYQPLLQTYGYFTEDEEIMKKAKPGKALIHLVPGTKPVLQLMGNFDQDLRDYFGYGKLINTGR